MTTQADYSHRALERLAFRRQFFLGSPGPELPAGWGRLTIDGHDDLLVHPDLEVCQASRGGKSVTLLGYMLDPHQPDADNRDIVDGLLARLEDAPAFWRETAELGGRWALVVHDGRHTVVLHDATGLRTVYYARPGGGYDAICASQPTLIAETLGLKVDEDASSFLAALGDDDCDVYWMPGDASPYADVACLLPNHYLDLRTGFAHRYWPDARLEPVPFGQGVAESQRLLRGLMASASRRQALAVSMTAGWDSRLMLALSRDLQQDLHCFTLVYPGSEHTRDVRVPAALLERLDMAHHLVGFPERPSEAFRAAYQRNIAAGGRPYCRDAQALYEQYPAGRVCVTGDVAEIVKCYYQLDTGEPAPVTGRVLAALAGVPDHAFAVRAFDRWIADAGPTHVPLLDLFCWEQFVGRKQALIRSQYDIVHESLAPLNCRRLLETMLGIDAKRRCGPAYELFGRLVRELWAETLSVPVNPREGTRLKRVFKRTLDSLGFYGRVPESIKELGRRVLTR